MRRSATGEASGTFPCRSLFFASISGWPAQLRRSASNLVTKVHASTGRTGARRLRRNDSVADFDPALIPAFSPGRRSSLGDTLGVLSNGVHYPAREIHSPLRGEREG